MDVEGVKLEFLGHSGFLIVCKDGKRIAIDPYNVSDLEKVDYVLITHGHYDHCSVKDIEKVIKPGSMVIGPAEVQSKITRLKDVEMQVIEVGDSFQLGRIKVNAMPAYNIGKEFHPKSEGFLGYVIKIDNLVVYHSGDSDKIPEMERLSGYGKHGNYFIVLLPVSGKYVMASEEAVEVAKILKPSLAVPMHYGAGVAGTEEDAKDFLEMCEREGINAKILEKV